MQNPMMSAVVYVCQQLSNMELAILNNYAQMDINPKDQPWYEKVQSLFTVANGTKMHTATKEALASVVLARL